ncbi:uncharacterized protein LOC135584032 isoform X2 [Musa acuminata AAA Group]|uniref:uncharacterized protein LOC135584032 isoform X2 n=1 Tax=Musa acuminata AAA Group TaxID=214697 RepID=UPI0031D7D2B7
MAAPSAPRPRREHGEEGETDRPRFFDAKARDLCWKKAEVVPGRHPERWRKDAAGNVVCKRFWHCQGCLCYEYDHIIPFSKENCQILQTRVNRLKSDKQWVDKAELEGFSCDIKFTGTMGGFGEADLCRRTREGAARLRQNQLNKELDIIEMAVYGDVIRPGSQCRCRTVAEMLGKATSKNPLAPCKLPYKEEQ